MPISLSAPRSIFKRTDDTLRAGWSLIVFLLIAFSFFHTQGWVIRQLNLLPGIKPGVQAVLSAHLLIVADGIEFLFLVAACLIMSLIDRRPFSQYGLGLRRSSRDFGFGLLCGSVSIFLIVAANALTHTIAFDGVALHGLAALASALKYALAFLCVGLLEEFLFRGYVQFTVTRGFTAIAHTLAPRLRDPHRVSFAIAAFLLSGLLFTWMHSGNPGETPWGLVVVGLNGLVFAFSLYRTGTLWWAIGFHTAWNWTQTCLLGAPDSGDTFISHLLNTHPVGAKLLSGGPNGPEGSLFALPVMVLVFVVVAVELPRRNPM